MGSPLDDGDTSLRHYFYLGEDAPGGTPAPEAAAVAAAGPSRAVLTATLGVGVGCGLLLSRLFKLQVKTLGYDETFDTCGGGGAWCLAANINIYVDSHFS
jgi:hypothetical protein